MTEDTPTPPPAASAAIDVDKLLEIANKIDARATQIAGDVLEEVIRTTKGDPEYVAIILGAVIVKLKAAHEAAEKMANG